LKNDIRRLEGVVEGVERSSKQSAREATQAQKETDQELRQIRKEVDQKIKQAIDNPLAGK
jgi:F0F1-type ATP synthase membrane subunit b/b'